MGRTLMPHRPRGPGVRRSSQRRPAGRGLNPGDRFEGEIHDLGTAGQGVVRHPSGRVFFAPGAWPGERGEFEIRRLRGRGGEARLVRLTLASPARRTSPCTLHGYSEDHCGGCPWMFVDYAAQLAAKERRVAVAAHRLAPQVTVTPIWGAEQSLAYRNRAQLKSDGYRLGYLAAGSHALVDVAACPILNEATAALLDTLREQLPNPAWRPTRRDAWVSLHIDDAMTPDDVITDTRRPFRQGNTAQNGRMRTWLADTVANLDRPAPAVELFAGEGNFSTVLLAEGCTPLTAVDSFAPAIEQLRHRCGGQLQAACLALDRPDALQTLQPALNAARLLVLDPPRDGFASLGACLDLAPALEAIVYISCDVATWARDAGVALAAGFELASAQPLDLFPHTPHVEILSLLRRA